ncbi:MAG: hypothetical protein H6617_07150 [Bdellovibrionaceae bacterium]|nr:hypothetical protein [Bdellovibrionales bacterium]MCB9254444.1 hypothetical protein [Pseudobdellovibrionaceae bacterium]
MQTRQSNPLLSRSWLPIWILVVALILIYRLPFLMNAAEVNSDFAFLALQAKRMWAGEWFWHLWGSSYQGVVEPLAIGALFKVFGDSPVVLMMEPLLGLIALITISLALFRRYLDPVTCFFLCLFYIFVPEDVLTINLYPFRQWSITVMFLSVLILERNAQAPRKGSLFFAGCLIAFAHYLDFYAIQFLAATFVYAALCLVEDRRKLSNYKPALPFLYGFGSGGILLLLVRMSLAQKAPLTFSLKTLFSAKHYEVFYSAFVHIMGLNWNLIPGTRERLAWGILLTLTGLVLFAGFFYGLYLCWRDKTLPEGLRRIGIFGGLSIFTSILATAGSPVAVDMWSSRYMTPIYWGAPFLLAPVAWKIGRLRFAAVFSWFSLTVGAIIWVCYPPVQRHFGKRVAALEDFLTANNIHHALSDYWVAYQLTYLFDEDPIVVSRNPEQERYHKYREAVDADPDRAEIFFSEKPEHVQAFLDRLRAEGVSFQVKDVEGFTVVWGHKLPNSYFWLRK